jgi:transcriptional regulator with AAA-type ATPase domain
VVRKGRSLFRNWLTRVALDLYYLRTIERRWGYRRWWKLWGAYSILSLWEKQLINDALQRTTQDRRKAAKLLDVTRYRLNKKITETSL